jgi:hypothetical protein
MTEIPPVRFAEGSDDIVEGLAVAFGGPFRGNSDLYKTRFDKADLHLDWFTERPVLYHHGQDPTIRASVIGGVKTVDITDYDDGTRKGKWIRAQLDKRHEYFDAIRSLVRDGALGWSHGTLDYLIEYEPAARDGTRNVKSWPIVEFTLTPVEANPDAFAVAMRSADEAVLKILGTTDEELRAKAPAKRDVSESSADASMGANVLAQMIAILGDEAGETDQMAMIQGAIDSWSQWLAAETAEIGGPGDMTQMPSYYSANRAGARNAAVDQGHINAAHAAAHTILTQTSAAGATCDDCAPGSGKPAADGEADGDDSEDKPDDGDTAARSADLGPVVFTVMGDAQASARSAWLSEAEKIGRERAAELRRP